MCAMFDDAILSAACMLLVSDCLFNRLCNDVLYNVHTTLPLQPVLAP